MEIKTHEIIFSNQIDTNSIKELIESINGVDLEKGIKIYFTTPGGELPATKILIHYLNKQVSEGREIELCGTWEMSSCGFIVFCLVKCKKSFLDAWSIVHMGTRMMDYKELQTKGSFEKFLLKVLEKQNAEIMEVYKEIGLTEKEIKRVKKGKDLYLNQERLKELFN